MTSADLSLLWAALWNWFGQLVSVAIPVGILVFPVLKWTGQRWVERRLNHDLEQFKREQQEKLEGFKGVQQKELERLRHLLSTRVSKIHEKEFEVLPKAWLMLNDLHGAVHRAVDLTIKYYPDFESFSEERLETFLKSEPTASSFSDSQKSELRQADDKKKYYMDAIMGHFIDEASDRHRLFQNYLIEHRIFMTDDLRTKFEDARKSLSSALSSYSIGRDHNNWELVRKGQDEMLNNMQNRIDAVEQAIQARLHYEEAY